MPLKDSIEILNKSAQMVIESVAKSDSFQVVDSIARADSITIADSIARVDSIALHTFKGYDGIIATGEPSHQSWVFLVLLFMFGIVVISFLRALSPPIEVFTRFFNTKERNSIFNKTSIDNIEQKIYFLLFSILSIALLGYLVFHESGQSFSFLTFLYCIVAVTLFFSAKWLVGRFLAYVFLDTNTLKILSDSYLHVVTFVSVLFYPLMLVILYMNDISTKFTIQAALSILILGLLLFVVKLVQIFLQKTVSSLYLLLYLCTFEILPLVGLILVFKYIALQV